MWACPHGKDVFQAARIRIVDWITLSSAGTQHDMPSGMSSLFSDSVKSERTTRESLSLQDHEQPSGETEFLSIFRTSSCQPSHAIVYPSRSRNPSPNSPFASEEFPPSTRRRILFPAVRNFKQHGAVSLVHILWFVEIEVRRKLDLPWRVARSFVQVHDLRL